MRTVEKFTAMRACGGVARTLDTPANRVAFCQDVAIMKPDKSI